MATIERKVAKVAKMKAKPKMVVTGPKAGYSQQVRKVLGNKSQSHKSPQVSAQSASHSGSGSGLSQPLVKAFLTGYPRDQNQEQDQEYSDTQEWISDNESVDLEAPILNEGSTWADNDVIADKSSTTWVEKVAAQESSFASRQTLSAI